MAKPKPEFPPSPEFIAKLFAAARERDYHSIHGSARIDDLDRVRELLDEGTPVDALDMHGHTALVWAACYGRAEILRLLISRGADLSPDSPHPARALKWAAICGHPDTVRILLEAGVDPNIRVRPERPSGAEVETTALHGAVRHRRDEVVRVLLAHGADPNARDGEGHTPWSLAATGRRPAAIRAMLKAAGAREV